MSVTKEAIEAAKAACWHETHNGGGYSDKCYEAALTAALPFLSTLHIAGEGKVKALVKAAKAAQERMLVEGYSLPEFDSAIAAFDGGADV